MKFQEKLSGIQNKNNSLLCVGLDSNFDRIPDHVKSKKNSIFEFNRSIIDATADLVCAYKPNSAFYEGLGARGPEQLKMTMDYLNEKHPDIVTIIDAKRGDIGNTNRGYIDYVFGYLLADSITLHPYMGRESLEPFLNLKDKGLIFLVRTSNHGSGEFQDLEVEGERLFKKVARQIKEEWNKNDNCLIVVGATYPKELAEVRQIADDMTFLVPGIGAQGGDVEATVKAGLNSQGKGMIINSSRGIIFASEGEDFAEAARRSALKVRDEINKYR